MVRCCSGSLTAAGRGVIRRNCRVLAARNRSCRMSGRCRLFTATTATAMVSRGRLATTTSCSMVSRCRLATTTSCSMVSRGRLATTTSCSMMSRNCRVLAARNWRLGMSSRRRLFAADCSLFVRGYCTRFCAMTLARFISYSVLFGGSTRRFMQRSRRCFLVCARSRLMFGSR